MIYFTHILETSLLMLAAYLLGCSVGYATHRVLYAGRGTRKVTAAAVAAAKATAQPAPRPRHTMTPAARLAAAATDDPIPSQLTTVPAGPSPALPQPAVKRPHAVAPTQSADKRAAPKPASMAAPRSGGADNLKQIKGIGPKIESALNDLGIYHFDQIAAWSPANVAWVDKQLAFKGRITRERWVEQASTFARPSRISA